MLARGVGHDRRKFQKIKFQKSNSDTPWTVAHPASNLHTAHYDAQERGLTRPYAAFAKPEIYEALEERGVKYAIRIPATVTWSETSRNC